jgi:hypothetical protein
MNTIDLSRRVKVEKLVEHDLRTQSLVQRRQGMKETIRGHIDMKKLQRLVYEKFKLLTSGLAKSIDDSIAKDQQ